ncbi:MAG: phosphatidylglycerophosphatase A family protein [Bdellovibrionota bacterium]
MAVKKRRVDFAKIKNFKQALAVVLGTALGAGLMPFAPGSAGTLVGMPLVWLSVDWDLPSRLALWGGLLVVGTWAAKVFDQTMGSKDNQSIVIDEVVGVGITAWTCPRDWRWMLAAFVLFRIFDIIKIAPVRQVDQWSKRKASDRSDPLAPWYGGFGVMADDVMAGVQGLIVILILQRFGFLA